MSKNWLNHKEWVTEQFQEKYLKKTQRNTFIHSLIIEGILVNKSGKDKFDLANKFLLYSGKINSSEFCVFNEIRRIRNRNAHDIFKNSGLSQKEIDELLNSLMNKIHEAYKLSNFLDVNLFRKYNVTRPSSIIFNPIN